MTDTNKPNWIGRECKKCWGEGYGQCMCDYGGILEEQEPCEKCEEDLDRINRGPFTKPMHKAHKCTALPEKEKITALQERYNEALDKITELEKDVEQLQKVLSGEFKRHTKTLEKVYAMRKHISQMSCCCSGCTKHNLDLEEKNKDTWGESE